MRSILTAATVAATLIAAASLAPTAAARTSTGSYETGTAPVLEAPCRGPLAGTSGACFDVAPEDTRVSIEVQDDVATHVGARYAIETEGGGTLASGSFCDHVLALSVPSAATDGTAVRLRVTVMAPGASSAMCGDTIAPPMGGQITAVFSQG